MATHLRNAVLALALLAGVGGAVAQTEPAAGPVPQSRLQLSESQRTAILNAVRENGTKVEPPPSFVATVGAPVPPSIELYALPDNALARVPEARRVKYTVMQEEVLLVDPTTMRVVEIIRP